MEIEQNKFYFYANFAETIKNLPEDLQADAYKAICEYGIYGILPDDLLLKSICLIATNSIYKNEGGAPKGNQNAIKKQPETTQNNPETTSKQPQNNLKTTLKQPQNNPETTQNNQKQPILEQKEEKKFSPFITPLQENNKNNNNIYIHTSEVKSGSIGTCVPQIKPEAQKTYAFEGNVIKLNEKDFNSWQKAYPDLNLYAELLQRDKYLAAQPPDEQKRWFLSTSKFFIKQNALRKAQNSNIAEQCGNAQNENDCWF